jgi:Ni/Co efflux regulator RcnB
MRKTLVTIFCSALIAASSIQVAAAAQHHAERHHARFRNSNNDQLRDPTAQAETSPKCRPGTSWVCTNVGCWCN